MSNDINADLARALGLSLDRLRAFTLRIEAQKPPVVVAEYYPKDISAAEFEMALTRHELRPVEQTPTVTLRRHPDGSEALIVSGVTGPMADNLNGTWTVTGRHDAPTPPL
jgi:hypothetical protein